MQEDLPVDQQNPHQRQKRPARPGKFSSPLRAGVHEYLKNHIPPSQLTSRDLSPETLVSTLPKRYTVYQPLLLLPSNIFTSTPEWQSVYSSLETHQLHDLYKTILASFGRAGVTHIAINAPIRPTDSAGAENRMRSPTNLVPLYGDFGELPPTTTQSESEKRQPTGSELNAAFWVRAIQNGGIIQTWAPLYTMFSRGNVVEKARILGLDGARFDGLDEESLGGSAADMSVVDMYAGIGYFIFSYLKRGIGRVWGWEINGWSVEGLCRGCRENGWGVKAVKVDENGAVEGGVCALVDGLTEEDRVVIFHGDNRFAGDVIMTVKKELEERGSWKKVRHVNLGLLPTARPSWKGAVRVLDPDLQGWIHVHENVDVKDIEVKKDEVVRELDTLVSQHRGGSSPTVECRHVERVKSYAPGVMHCVFDVYISASYLLGDSQKPKEKNKCVEYS